LIGQLRRFEHNVSPPFDRKERTKHSAAPRPAFTNVPPVRPIGGKAQDLPLHRVNLSEECRDVVVAAALAGDQTEAAARRQPLALLARIDPILANE
jgi:hypothetical protein